MKKIEAIIRPHKLDQVREALIAAGILGMTVSEVRGHGRQKGKTEMYRGQEYTVDLLPKIMIELVVPSSRVEDAIKTLCNTTRSGVVGDGKLFITDVIDAFRIRSGEHGEEVL